eukprot:SM014196S00641  [mRNA]  locus=s14196:151:237:+ [translate_table: standard]
MHTRAPAATIWTAAASCRRTAMSTSAAR